MTVLHRYAHTGTAAGTVTTGNSGYDASTGSGTAATYQTNTWLNGATTGIRFNDGAASWLLQTNDDARCSAFLMRFTSAPSAAMQICRKRGTGVLAILRWNTDRTISILDGAASVIATSSALSINTTYQIVWDVPGDSTQALRIYDATGTQVGSTVSGAATAGTVTDTQLGQNSASASATWDCGQHRTANALLHPLKAPTSAWSGVVTGLSVAFTDTAAAQTGDGETLTYDWDWGDGSAHGTTHNPTHVYGTAGNKTVVLTVTDTDGMTSNTSHVVAPTAASAPGHETLTKAMNRLAGTTGLAAQGAANIWAGTSGLDLVDALNHKAGNSFPTGYRDLQGVLNQLAGTSGLGVDGAASQIAA